MPVNLYDNRTATTASIRRPYGKWDTGILWSAFRRPNVNSTRDTSYGPEMCAYHFTFEGKL